MKRQLERIALVIMSVILVLTLPSVPAGAVNNEIEYLFDLSTDADYTQSVAPGDVITVTFTLRRTDSSESYTMYGMQNEITYDATFYELVEDSITVEEGIESRSLKLRDEFSTVYMNFVSFSGGEEWAAEKLIGSFQLRVIGDTGSAVIMNKKCFVSTKDGQDKYASTARDVTFTVSDYCVVRFESNGGSAIDNQAVLPGETVAKPENPVRNGYTFDAWYANLDRTQEWDFQTDTVSGNMTLYAGWEADGAEQPSAAPETKTSDGGRSGFLWLIVTAAVVVVAAVTLLLFRKRKKRNRTGAN